MQTSESKTAAEAADTTFKHISTESSLAIELSLSFVLAIDERNERRGGVYEGDLAPKICPNIT
jgi:hypothetical protein